MAKDKGEFEFDMAVSFAGEDRATAEQFSNLVKAEGFSVFYDFWNKADLWGRDLYSHLAEVYSKKARFCVMFISASYAKKAWTRHEMKAAQTRAFRENEAYILPIRLDDTAIPGIGETVAYLDLRRDTITEAAEVAIEKLKSVNSRNSKTSDSVKVSVTTTKPTVGSPLLAGNLQIKKQFTELDRDTFLSETFEKIANDFESSLKTLEAEHDGIVGKYRRVSANHFTAIIYRNGKNASACGIRMGGMFGGNQILYSNDPNSTNSMNEAVKVENDGQNMFLKAMGITSIMSGDREKNAGKLTPEDAAELFWNMLFEPLRR